MDAQEKLNEMKCSQCRHSDAEYYFTTYEEPLCKDCLCEILIEEANDLGEICELEDDNEDDVEVINKLWEEQEHCHKEKK